MIDGLEFSGRRVLVTGGTKGIGEAIAARLREGGATVLVTARARPAAPIRADPAGSSSSRAITAVSSRTGPRWASSGG